MENDCDLVFVGFFLNERNVFISVRHFYCGLRGTAKFYLMVNLLKEAVEIERWAFSTQIFCHRTLFLSQMHAVNYDLRSLWYTLHPQTTFPK